MASLQRGLLNTHDQASSALGGVGSAKGFFSDLWGSFRGKKADADQDAESSSTPSSSTWSSDSDHDVKKRLLLRKRSWGVRDLDVTGAEEQSDWLVVLVVRFLCGLGLSQGFYLLLTYHSSWKADEAIWWSALVGFPVAVGMAFSKTVRCVVTLLLPTFCTGKGRAIILAFTLMLLVTGPAANVAYNYREITRSMTCGDELGYNMTQGLGALVHEGQNAVLSTMADTVDVVVDAVETAEEVFQEFAEKLQSVADIVRHMNDFIRNMGSVCSDKLGAFLCIIPNFVAKQAKKLITDPVRDAIRRVKEEFEFEMSYSHEFRYEVNASKTMANITADILNEIKEKISGVTDMFEWVRFAMGFSTVFVILKAIKYRHKYLTSNEFDNCYVTEQLQKLDKKRKRKGGVAVLPLRARENSKYISPNRIWMSRSEIKKFSKGISSMTFHLIYAVAVIFVDYSLWWLLHQMAVSLTLRQEAATLLEEVLTKGATSVMGNGADERTKEIVTKLISLSVGGMGFVSIIYRSIASAMQRLANSEGYEFSIEKCLPNPKPPDYYLYAFIASLYTLLYVFCLTEAYVLRARRRIMARYYPKREKARILFLRAKILSGRGLSAEKGLANAIKKACLKVQQSKEEDRYDFMGRLSHRRGVVGWLARCMSGRTRYRCDVCKLAGGKRHSHLFTNCPTFGCKACYCVECYEDLHRMCVVCLMKESSAIRKRRRSSVEIEDEEDHDPMADYLLDSSGISDSSASSCEEGDEDATEDEEQSGRRKKSVRFRSEVDTRYVPIPNESYSDDEEESLL